MFLGRIFLGHQGPRCRDIPDKNFMQVAFFCCFRHGVAGMSRDLGQHAPDLEKFDIRKLWAAWWTFRILFILFFSVRGRGKRRRRPRRWPGGSVKLKIEGGGGGVFRRGGVGGGRALGECQWGGGGGLNIFFSGPKFPPRLAFRSKRKKRF